MFGFFRGQSRSASGAILYVTVGALLMIWSGLWYFYFLRPDPNPPVWQSFTCMGIILSGTTIAAIGLLFGLIGRGAKGADTTVAITPSTVPVVPAGVNTNPIAGAPVVPTEQIPVAAATSVFH